MSGSPSLFELEPNLTKTPRIISASRRTDVPAFHSRWLLERLNEGHCDVRNPYGGQSFRVSLKPEDCVAIVFWTRNPHPMLKYIPELQQRGYRLFFHYTIVDYPRIFEPRHPDLRIAIRNFQKTSDLAGPTRVFWRYDPIILSSVTPLEHHLERFSGIAGELDGFTSACIFSFVSFYGKVRRRFNALTKDAGVQFENPCNDVKRDLTVRLSEKAAANGISMFACCEDRWSELGVRQAHCIGKDMLLAGDNSPAPYKPRPTRRGCGCIESKDIGSYGTCKFGCIYCYAV